MMLSATTLGLTASVVLAAKGGVGADDYVYVGIDGDGFPSNFDVNAGSTSKELFASGSQSIAFATVVSTKYMVIAQRADQPDLTGITYLGNDEFANFTKYSNSFSVAGQAFDAWASTSTVNFATLIGESVTLDR